MRTVNRSAVPALTTEQMRAVDRAMVEDLHIELVQMMENAGRSLAELAIARFSPGPVTVLAGPGGNGGGGLVAARHLVNRGCQVQVVLAASDRLTPVPAQQADILARMGVSTASQPWPRRPGHRRPDRLQLAGRPRRQGCRAHYLGQRPGRADSGPRHP
jgi:NAD(P)H-hydrate epimerase